MKQETVKWSCRTSYVCVNLCITPFYTQPLICHTSANNEVSILSVALDINVIQMRTFSPRRVLAWVHNSDINKKVTSFILLFLVTGSMWSMRVEVSMSVRCWQRSRLTINTRSQIRLWKNKLPETLFSFRNGKLTCSWQVCNSPWLNVPSACFASGFQSSKCCAVNKNGQKWGFPYRH